MAQKAPTSLTSAQLAKIAASKAIAEEKRAVSRAKALAVTSVRDAETARLAAKVAMAVAYNAFWRQAAEVVAAAKAAAAKAIAEEAKAIAEEAAAAEAARGGGVEALAEAAAAAGGPLERWHTLYLCGPARISDPGVVSTYCVNTSNLESDFISVVFSIWRICTILN
jgi:hypothetical protein